IANIAGLSQPIIKQKALTIDKVKKVQTALNKKGFNAGLADGIFGSKSKRALQDFQLSMDLAADGYPDEATLLFLLDSPKPNKKFGLPSKTNIKR
ncbi:MAG: peptidoglycan-binding protein, partial [Gammaproteobacteria bacterium]|nr:peptidoglycan-binding protein [Gammaproteobacteria bacterium]